MSKTNQKYVKKKKNQKPLSLNSTNYYSPNTSRNDFMFRCPHILLATGKMFHLEETIFLTIEIHWQRNQKSWHFHSALYPGTHYFALTCTAVACWEAKKTDPCSGCRSNIFTTCKTRHSIPIKIRQKWYINAYCWENLPAGKPTPFIAKRRIFPQKLSLMLLLQLKILPCSHEMAALSAILEIKIAGQTDRSRQG